MSLISSITDVQYLPLLSSERRRHQRQIRGRRARSEESGGKIGYGGTESYLSRWSRENSPAHPRFLYSKTVNRSFTPVREQNSNDCAYYQSVEREYRRSVSPMRSMSMVGSVASPHYTNYNFYKEQQPLRKWDVFQVRTWSYPIWKHIFGRDSSLINSGREQQQHKKQHIYGNSYYSTKPYTLYTHYRPPMLAAELRSPTVRRGYSGYNYLAAHHSFDIVSRPRSLDMQQYRRSRMSGSPWHWDYYGHAGLRHFSAYKPRSYAARVRTYRH